MLNTTSAAAEIRCQLVSRLFMLATRLRGSATMNYGANAASGMLPDCRYLLIDSTLA
ncbi:MAG: hypothetical protein HQ518_22710 [Rhodopirellula sp.]|nr:hypothetical protein [Rhodopirellula sp.]